MVLNHKYYDILRKKYKLPTISMNALLEDGLSSENTSYTELLYEPDFTDIEKVATTPTADEIRREVAYLSGKYREVIVRHYLNGEKVQDIADSLEIPKGTPKPLPYFLTCMPFICFIFLWLF